MDTDVKVAAYVVRFAIAYVLVLIALGLLMTLLEFNAGSGVSVGALIAGVAFAVSKFVKDHRRAPTPGERKRLTWWSLGASILVSAALVAPLALADGQLSELIQMLSQLNLLLVLGVALFVLALHLLVLWYSYGGLAKSMTRSRLRAQSRG